MRTYGRITNPDGSKTWVVVETDANGNNDAVMLTTLAQNLLGVLGESPFYAQRGIPAQQSVIQQVFPDYYVALTQNYFAPFFASLQVAKVNDPAPVYRINVLTHQGAQIAAEIPI